MGAKIRFRKVPSLLLCLFLIPFVTSTAAQAEPPRAPVVLDSTSGGCVPSTEICGDGVDQDCNGSDRLCPGTDKDYDGYAGSADCDDTDRQVYPGISVACAAAGGHTGTKTCQGNGSFTGCSASPLCEATGTGKCYYVSAISGADTNPGTFQAPFKTFRRFTSYYGGAGEPSNAFSLSAGDVVYFMSGVYSSTYTYSNDKVSFFFRNVNGTPSNPIKIKAYPGAHPVFTPATNAPAFHILQSSNILLEGFEVMRAFQYGVYLSASTNIEVRNMWIHDTDGYDNDNISGIFVGWVNGLNIHHSLIHDNYDRTCTDTGGNKTENSRNIVLFKGGTARINHNVIFQTPPISAQKTGGCITYKHAADVTGATFEVDHNIMWNCFHPVIGSGTYGTRIHHNLILNSDPIEIRDFGGPTWNSDIIIEKNTIVNTKALSHHPTGGWNPVGLMTFRKNIIVDNASGYNFETGMVTIDPYGSDAGYTDVMGTPKVAFSQNCYYNAAVTPVFPAYARNGGTQYGSLGSIFSFSQWQGLGFDAGSAITNPNLDADFTPTNGACTGAGRWVP